MPASAAAAAYLITASVVVVLYAARSSNSAVDARYSHVGTAAESECRSDQKGNGGEDAEQPEADGCDWIGIVHLNDAPYVEHECAAQRREGGGWRGGGVRRRGLMQGLQARGCTLCCQRGRE
jgi:hypothetical protein